VAGPTMVGGSIDGGETGAGGRGAAGSGSGADAAAGSTGVAGTAGPEGGGGQSGGGPGGGGGGAVISCSTAIPETVPIRVDAIAVPDALPTPTGGTILDGTYQLVAAGIFTGPGGMI